MNASLWRQIHGGSTHLPITLLLASAVFDWVAWRSRDEALRRGLHAAGLGSAVVGMLGGVGAVMAGLVMTRGRILGGGYERIHHLFVWPAFMASLVLVGWRLFRNGRIPTRGLRVYLVGMGVAGVLMVGAGYSGGEMLLAGDNVPALSAAGRPTIVLSQLATVGTGRQLFLKNCAHCHGADAHGDEGPDLHNLDWTDEQIATRIRNGKKGQMTAFAGKLSSEDIKEVVAYLRTLK
jgi:mono/diheme cytochrome c family protein